jgi:hypothetical protein
MTLGQVDKGSQSHGREQRNGSSQGHRGRRLQGKRNCGLKGRVEDTGLGGQSSSMNSILVEEQVGRGGGRARREGWGETVRMSQ